MNTAGIYAVNFYALGTPVSVVIDDFIPTQDHMPWFSREQFLKDDYKGLTQAGNAKIG